MSEEVYSSSSDMAYTNDDKACFSEMSSTMMMNEVCWKTSPWLAINWESNHPMKSLQLRSLNKWFRSVSLYYELSLDFYLRQHRK